MAHILTIEDSEQVTNFLAELISQLGHSGSSAGSISAGQEKLRSGKYDLLLLDLELPDGNSLSILPDLLSLPSAPEILIITGTGDIQGAELAFKSGAWDFIPKPLNTDQVKLSITRALQYRKEKLESRAATVLSRDNVIGESSTLKSCLELVGQVAGTDTSILITGDTGTGKELIARTIHDNSGRRENTFIVVDCASLTESLVESILFGHQKGAFTNAMSDSPGLIRQAEQGTLFLDEVGEMELSIQKKFLRVLQEQTFRPIGDVHEVKADFRLLAATNRNLDEMVDKGAFRRDLLYRLQGTVIHLPSLKERATDVGPLVMHYLEKKFIDSGTVLKGCSPEFLDALSTYDWPGNVRELFNALDHALSSSGDAPILYPVHLPPHLRLPQLKNQLTSEHEQAEPARFYSGLDNNLPTIQEFRSEVIQQAEKEYLTVLMKSTSGRIKAACDIAGLSESRLHALLKNYNIPRFRNR